MKSGIWQQDVRNRYYWKRVFSRFLCHSLGFQQKGLEVWSLYISSCGLTAPCESAMACYCKLKGGLENHGKKRKRGKDDNKVAKRTKSIFFFSRLLPGEKKAMFISWLKWSCGWIVSHEPVLSPFGNLKGRKVKSRKTNDTDSQTETLSF